MGKNVSRITRTRAAHNVFDIRFYKINLIQFTRCFVLFCFVERVGESEFLGGEFFFFYVNINVMTNSIFFCFFFRIIRWSMQKKKKYTAVNMSVLIFLFFFFFRLHAPLLSSMKCSLSIFFVSLSILLWNYFKNKRLIFYSSFSFLSDFNFVLSFSSLIDSLRIFCFFSFFFFLLTLFHFN